MTKEIKLSECIEKNYSLLLSTKEIDCLLDLIPMQVQAHNYAFDKSFSLKEKTELTINVRRLESLAKKLALAIAVQKEANPLK